MSATTLHDRATRLAELSTDWPDLHERAIEILGRTRTNEFRIAVVGEFKRGKSTLLNALIGRDLLPTGVLPVTAVPIEVVSGDEQATVYFADDRQTDIPLSEIEQFTTEAENPGNRLGVARVAIAVTGELLDQGLTFVDVPGMGSIHEGATETAIATYGKVDGAVLVLSMDSPLSAVERREAVELEVRGARLFVVVNKVDHYDSEQRSEVQRYVALQLNRSVEDIYCLSARAALRGELDDAGDYLRFRSELGRFVSNDLVRTRQDLLTREMALIRAGIGERANLELLAGELDIDELETKIRSLRDTVARERARHDGDRRAIAGDVAALAAEVRSRLLDDAERAYAKRRSDIIGELAQQRSLDAARREGARRSEAIVRDEFERIWADEAAHLDTQWQSLMQRHRDETEMRLAGVRAVALDLFAVGITLGQPPVLERDPEQNLFYFPPPMSVTSGLVDPLRRLVPASLCAAESRTEPRRRCA